MRPPQCVLALVYGGPRGLPPLGFFLGFTSRSKLAPEAAGSAGGFGPARGSKSNSCNVLHLRPNIGLGALTGEQLVTPARHMENDGQCTKGRRL